MCTSKSTLIASVYTTMPGLYSYSAGLKIPSLSLLSPPLTPTQAI